MFTMNAMLTLMALFQFWVGATANPLGLVAGVFCLVLLACYNICNFYYVEKD